MRIRKTILTWLVLGLLAIGGCQSNKSSSGSLTVAISPYQDIAMIVNADSLKLESKYALKLNLVTMSWEDILPAVASAGRTVDVGFGSLTEYLTKYGEFNKNASDSIMFIYPLYVFNAGAFVTFNDSVPSLNKETIKDTTVVKQFLGYRIGAQRESIYEMMLYALAGRVGVNPKDLNLFDTPLNDGFLAASSHSLDISSAGLTQLTETLKLNGRVVLNMDALGFADITGFICKKSTLVTHDKEIRALIQIWFDCVSHVFADIDRNSHNSLEYLRTTASTDYTLEEYKKALSQEFFPKSLADSKEVFLRSNGVYSLRRISSEVNEYLLHVGKTQHPAPIPVPLDVIE